MTSKSVNDNLQTPDLTSIIKESRRQVVCPIIVPPPDRESECIVCKVYRSELIVYQGASLQERVGEGGLWSIIVRDMEGDWCGLVADEYVYLFADLWR